MRYPAAFLEEIRTRLPCSSVVGRRVKLKKAGREFVGLSPFNKEKSPSFFVNDQKAAWFDHSAGKNGDAFAFLMLTEGLSFPEAVTRLAGEAGVPMPKADAESVRREAHREELIDVLEAANDCFRESLAAGNHLHQHERGSRGNGEHSSPAAEGPAAIQGSPLAYLARRGIGPEEIDKFQIGYAPSDRSFLKQRLSSSYSQDALAEAGLLIHGEDIPVSYDRFRDRIMFPIRDQRGKVIGFGGRTLGDDPRKYVNSPETPTFDKGRVLYHGDAARQPAWDGAPLVVVEGYTATISSVRAGYAATVATMGTALTEDHLQALWRMSDEPVICFDGDPAGKRAARKVIDRALPLLLPGRSLRFASLPGGLDPDDVVRTRGPGAYDGIIKSAYLLFDFFWRSTIEGRSLASPEARAKLRTDLDSAIGKIPDEDLRREYFGEAHRRVKALSVGTAVNRSNGYSSHSTSISSIRLTNGFQKRAGMNLRDAMIVSAMVASPVAAQAEMESLALDESLSPEAQAAVHAISDALATLEAPDTETLQAALLRAGVGATIAAARTICNDSGIKSLDPGADPLAAAQVLAETRH